MQLYGKRFDVRTGEIDVGTLVSETLVKLDEPKQRRQRGGFALPRLARFIVATLPRFVGILLLWAASLKVWDESGVRQVLAFDGVPESLLPTAVSLVIVVESALGVLLLLRPRSRAVLDAAIVLLAIYAAQLVYLAAFRDAPNCVCLGAWRAYRAARFDNLMGVGRNVCLVLALIWVRAQPVARVSDP